MNTRLAQKAGFCFGVKRAVDTVYSQIELGKNIYTYGPIIHNDEVVKDLESKGVHVINDIGELSDINDGTLIIRSHGVSKKEYELLENSGLELIDATCPFVKRIHNTVLKESSRGCKILIAGNENHPEVTGILGWCTNGGRVIESVDDAKTFKPLENTEYCLVSQTTFNSKKFQDIVDIFTYKGYNVNVVDTICSATEERQTEARKIASEVDAMIVIGGKHSSNTQKLYEICKGECENTYFIQTLEDLNFELPDSVGLVGITAGASTPNNIIEEVQNNVRTYF